MNPDLFAVTLDLDWAPDCAVDFVADLLAARGVRATWFITHDSPAVRRLFSRKDLFEFGLHPNFLPGSTQGADEREIMENLGALMPGAKIIRTHGLFQSSRLLERMVRDYGITTDVSLFLPGAAHLAPHRIHFDYKIPALLRIPYFWEDDIELFNPGPRWDFEEPGYHVRGLKIFNFHPLFVYINFSDMDRYNTLKKTGPLNGLSDAQLRPFLCRERPGPLALFHHLCDFIAEEQKQSMTISEIAKAWGARP